MQVDHFLAMASQVAVALQHRTWVLQTFQIVVFFLSEIIVVLTLGGGIWQWGGAICVAIAVGVVVNIIGKQDHQAQAQNLLLQGLPQAERQRMIEELRRIRAFIE